MNKEPVFCGKCKFYRAKQGWFEQGYEYCDGGEGRRAWNYLGEWRVREHPSDKNKYNDCKDYEAKE